MTIKESYNTWSLQYDTEANKARDLEEKAMRGVLAGLSFQNCLEIGCGTGKNTTWLLEKAEHVTAVDLSEQMIEKARNKISSEHISFILADINSNWNFLSKRYDLVVFSLILEHISELDHIFKETSAVLQDVGYVYIGELHPFKQYGGSKASFETKNGKHTLECYSHHISEFIQSAKKYALQIVELNEYFDEPQSEIPRILTLLLKKNKRTF